MAAAALVVAAALAVVVVVVVAVEAVSALHLGSHKDWAPVQLANHQNSVASSDWLETGHWLAFEWLQVSPVQPKPLALQLA